MSARGPWAALVAAVIFLSSPPTALGDFPDCNENGIDDVVETATIFTEMAVGDGSPPHRLADLDGDGDLDLVGGTALGWRENLDGAGTFGPLQSIDTFDGEVDVVPADVDGDGDLDLVVGVGDTSDCVADPTRIRVYDNDGSGSFGAPLVILTLLKCAGWCPNMARLAVGDRDTDGDLDVSVYAIECSWGRIVTLWNDGTGDSWTETEAGYQSPALEVVDVNCDAANDLVMTGGSGNDYGELNWLEGPADAVQHLNWSINIPGLFIVADLDGDGDRDVLADRYRSGEHRDLAVHTNVSGVGHFFETQMIEISTTSSWPLVELAGGDLDGDGDTDLAWTREKTMGEPVRWNSNVRGSFELSEPIGSKPEFYAAFLDSGDIDGDGDVDLLVSYVCHGSGSCVDDSVVWLRNDGDDCNGNRMPDECEADCNDNGIVDACDIRGGASVDCDGNGTPDECEAPCREPCDSDGDGCRNGVDGFPGDPNLCGDSDADGCDDCSGGHFDPANDGTNSDADGVCDLTDCDPLDNTVWTEPEPATGLRFVPEINPWTTMTWSPPQSAGGIAWSYDVLRSTVAADFVSGANALCFEPGIGREWVSDAETPSSRGIFHYLIRVDNGCPGDGAMGSGSGTPRVGLECVQLPSGDGLVVNEVDYIQPGGSDREFVEIFNPSDAPVDLTDLVLIITSFTGSEITRVDLAGGGAVAPGGYLVVASSNVVVDPAATVILFPADQGNISSAGGGAVLFDLGSNTIVDALSFRREVTFAVFDGVPGSWNLVEGNQTPWTDIEDYEASMVRYPNGVDTDDAYADWRATGPPAGSPTPGSANTTAW